MISNYNTTDGRQEMNIVLLAVIIGPWTKFVKEFF